LVKIAQTYLDVRKKGAAMTQAGSENDKQIYRYEIHFQNLKDLHEFGAALLSVEVALSATGGAK
jgi:hypothetical protein